MQGSIVFARSKTYKRSSTAQRKKVPPRIDLELEALSEILEGTRLLHCHSYRQDEILMLTRIAEDFGFTIATFQHVLEGYKIAERLNEHGAGASTFSDWWQYKYEVIDAIPYNGSMMAKNNVLVSCIIKPWRTRSRLYRSRFSGNYHFATFVKLYTYCAHVLHSCFGDSANIRQKLSFIFQFTAHFANFSVKLNVFRTASERNCRNFRILYEIISWLHITRSISNKSFENYL